MPNIIYYSRPIHRCPQSTRGTCHVSTNVSWSLSTLKSKKSKKPIVNDFKEFCPLKYICVGYIFCWSRFWTNSFDLEALLTTCDHGDLLRALFFSTIWVFRSSDQTYFFHLLFFPWHSPLHCFTPHPLSLWNPTSAGQTLFLNEWNQTKSSHTSTTKYFCHPKNNAVVAKLSRTEEYFKHCLFDDIIPMRGEQQCDGPWLGFL